MQEIELDQEGASHHSSAVFAHQLRRGRGSAPGGEHVVHDEDAIRGTDGVTVHLESIGAILEGVLHTSAFRRQLPGLPHRYEPCFECQRDRRPQQETA